MPPRCVKLLEAAIATVMMQITSKISNWTERDLTPWQDEHLTPRRTKTAAFETQQKILAKKPDVWRQKSALGSIKHLLQFFPLIRSELAGTLSPVTV